MAAYCARCAATRASATTRCSSTRGNALSAAELEPALKNQLSHRGQALAQAAGASALRCATREPGRPAAVALHPHAVVREEVPVLRFQFARAGRHAAALCRIYRRPAGRPRCATVPISAQALDTRPIVSIFFGGGTPSLFAPELIDRLLMACAPDCRISSTRKSRWRRTQARSSTVVSTVTLRPASTASRFGVQSFDDDKLRRLGRIHSAAEAEAAVKLAQDAGYTNINLDLMYALPRQTLDGALHDVQRAVALAPAHISHYQLTLEPNTVFAANPPPLPDDDHAWEMQEACQAQLGCRRLCAIRDLRLRQRRPALRAQPQLLALRRLPGDWRRRARQAQ